MKTRFMNQKRTKGGPMPQRETLESFFFQGNETEHVAKMPLHCALCYEKFLITL